MFVPGSGASQEVDKKQHFQPSIILTTTHTSKYFCQQLKEECATNKSFQLLLHLHLKDLQIREENAGF
ncbi:hypothetical protein FKM82_023234 [Ascaphus truei]